MLGLYLSVWLDVPPGPAVAVLGAGAYGVCAAGLAVAPRARALRGHGMSEPSVSCRGLSLGYGC